MGSDHVLTATPDGGWNLSSPISGSGRDFNANGRLVRIRDGWGNRLVFSYDAVQDRITRIDDAVGRHLLFYYNAQGRLHRIEDPMTAMIPNARRRASGR